MACTSKQNVSRNTPCCQNGRFLVTKNVPMTFMEAQSTQHPHRQWKYCMSPAPNRGRKLLSDSWTAEEKVAYVSSHPPTLKTNLRTITRTLSKGYPVRTRIGVLQVCLSECTTVLKQLPRGNDETKLNKTPRKRKLKKQDHSEHQIFRLINFNVLGTHTTHYMYLEYVPEKPTVTNVNKTQLFRCTIRSVSGELFSHLLKLPWSKAPPIHFGSPYFAICDATLRYPHFPQHYHKTVGKKSFWTASNREWAQNILLGSYIGNNVNSFCCHLCWFQTIFKRQF